MSTYSLINSLLHYSCNDKFKIISLDSRNNQEPMGSSNNTIHFQEHAYI